MPVAADRPIKVPDGARTELRSGLQSCAERAVRHLPVP
jgi:hypothetical protein